MDIRLRDANARSLLSFFDPRFHFGQVPHHATRRQIEAAWELAAALHFVDRRFSQGDDLPHFLAADGATERSEERRVGKEAISVWDADAEMETWTGSS